jgi:polar amino acid transport system substrate-binding protein
MRTAKTVIALVLGAAMTFLTFGEVFAGETQKQLTSESVIETIKKRGKLKVGMATFVPWAMRNKKGDLIGFEIDVAKKLAKDMGVKIQFVPTAWSGIIPALIAGKFDTIIGGMSVTPQRNLTINFTAPYAHSGMGIAANKKLSGNLAWPDGYNSRSVTFTCRRGATSCTDIKNLWPKAKLRQFDDDSLAFQEVINGNAHATVTSHPKPAKWVFKHRKSSSCPRPKTSPRVTNRLVFARAIRTRSISSPTGS